MRRIRINIRYIVTELGNRKHCRVDGINRRDMPNVKGLIVEDDPDQQYNNHVDSTIRRRCTLSKTTHSRSMAERIVLPLLRAVRDE
jgi:hypothetical protein